MKSWPKSVYFAGVTIFTDFDEFLKASKALNATKQCFFFVKSWPKSVYLVKRARHIYLHQVHVILLMLTAETVTLNNWTILQNVFCILFRKYSRHIHLRHVYVVNANTLSIVSICKRKKKLNYWTILQNVFSLFLAKGQDIFTFVISRNFAHGDFRNSITGQFFKIFSYSFSEKAKTCSSLSCSYSLKCFWIPFSKRPRHIYLHHVPVILLMLTAETLTLDNSSKCFSDSF